MSGNCIGERSDPKLSCKLAYSWEGNPKSPFIPTVVVILMDFFASRATRKAERDPVPELLDHARQRGFHPRTLGGDKSYETRECGKTMQDRGVTPCVARRTHLAMNGRTTRHPGCGVSRKIRRPAGEIIRRTKTVHRSRRTRCRGVGPTAPAGYFVAAAYNMVRTADLLSGREPRAV